MVKSGEKCENRGKIVKNGKIGFKHPLGNTLDTPLSPYEL